MPKQNRQKTSVCYKAIYRAGLTNLQLFLDGVNLSRWL